MAVELTPPVQEWSPQFAPHVVLRYEQRRMGAAGVWAFQTFVVTCGKCGQKWGSLCQSGRVREQGAAFARRHLHRDALDPIPKEPA